MTKFHLAAAGYKKAQPLAGLRPRQRPTLAWPGYGKGGPSLVGFVDNQPVDYLVAPVHQQSSVTILTELKMGLTCEGGNVPGATTGTCVPCYLPRVTRRAPVWISQACASYQI